MPALRKVIMIGSCEEDEDETVVGSARSVGTEQGVHGGDTPSWRHSAVLRKVPTGHGIESSEWHGRQPVIVSASVG